MTYSKLLFNNRNVKEVDLFAEQADCSVMNEHHVFEKLAKHLQKNE
jgi:hypothetical protein